jgi:excisionase family DNA binding protein
MKGGGYEMSQSNLSHLSVSGQENLLTPAEVAALFRVDPKTVTRWAKAGKLTSIRTLGGHRRYKESEVKALLKTITPNTSPNQVGAN